MKLRHLLAVGILTAMAACSKSQEAPVPASPVPPETAASADNAPNAQAGAASAESAGADIPAEATPAAAQSAPPAVSSSAVSVTEGKDYVRIADGAPFDTEGGKIEVAEVFNYVCPACSGFNPTFQEWKKRQPAYVHVVYVPADFRPDFKVYARAFYAADALGLVERTHAAVYAAVHEDHTLPGEGMAVDPAKIAAFYARFGADPQEFQQLMESFSVNAKVTKAHQFMTQSQVRSTPSLVINGKYLVKGKTWDEILKNADALIAREHAR
jgi:thiol:disulfide interchange protein DsbA